MDSWFKSLSGHLKEQNINFTINPLTIFHIYNKVKANLQINEKLTQIELGIEKINEKLDYKNYQLAQTGVRHLVDALNSDIVSVKKSEFLMARQIFNELIHISTNNDNYKLQILGYWGNYIYFNLQNDYLNALIQVFECTIQYPLEAFEIFPQYIYQFLLVDKNLSLLDVLKSINDNCNQGATNSELLLKYRNFVNLDKESMDHFNLYGIGMVGMIGSVLFSAPLVIGGLFAAAAFAGPNLARQKYKEYQSKIKEFNEKNVSSEELTVYNIAEKIKTLESNQALLSKKMEEEYNLVRYSCKYVIKYLTNQQLSN